MIAHDDPRWEKLRAVFPADQVEKLPKQIKREDQDKGTCARGTRYCADSHPCGRWHARSIHLDYVGHAGVTMRLNDVDPMWTWEPMALTADGLPLMSPEGLWLKLTILGVTRLGFGDSGSKRGPDAIKELIGDGIRNAAMRFGVGTYLWSKSDHAANLQATEAEPKAPEPTQADLTAAAKKRAWDASAAISQDRDARQELIKAALAHRKLTTDTATAADWDAIATEELGAK